MRYEERITQRLTRYVSFPKYVDFLLNGLYAPKAAAFEDPWEGHVFFTLRDKGQDRGGLTELVDGAKHWIYASCWHASDAESYAMWRIYGQYQEAVSIHTTFDALKALMANYAPGADQQLSLLTVVLYADPADGALPTPEPDVIYSTGWGNPHDTERDGWRQLMQTGLGIKPTAYSYEREVRLLLLDPGAPTLWDIPTPVTPSAPGFRLPRRDPSEFLTGVTVAPYAPEWFVKVVYETSRCLGLDVQRVPVGRSRMYDRPP